MALLSNRYGKGRVRIMRVKRDTARHEVRELTVEVMLEGDFAGAYVAADNRSAISTDTIKNVVNVVAHAHLDLPNELFAKIVAERFLADYPQIETVSVHAIETRWSRLVTEGSEHPHSFVLDGNGKPFASVTAARTGLATTSGIEGFTVLKTTNSGWADFHVDSLTTLKPTHDRLCATSLRAAWTWAGAPADYPKFNAVVLDTMLAVFATTYSNSVQDSLYRMGMAALAAVPEVATISMAAPNKHYIPMNLEPFGLAFEGTLFLPTDEPHGQIECTVGRG